MSMERIRKKRSLTVNSLPPQVAWLDGISMSVMSLVSWPQPFYRHVTYLLTVTCLSRTRAEPSTWRLVRSFDEFRFLRKRLVVALKRGHFCQAECPWLYTFLKSYYPRSQLVGSSSARVINIRRKKLTRSLATIQSFLISKVNHVCPLVLQDVASELLEFVIGGHRDLESDCHDEVPVWLRQLLHQWHDGDLEVNDLTNSASMPSNFSVFKREICTLCDDTMLDQHKSQQQADADEDGWSRFEAAESFSSLSCGHHFHDECLIQKLNEAMKCPTCGHSETTPT